jgi:hypothetical protein
MEEDLGKEGIELKAKKPRSDAQVKAFEKAREIRLENSKIKKEKIAEVKEQVKNRNKVEKPIVATTTPSFQGQSQDLRPVEKPIPDKARDHRGLDRRDTPLTAVPLKENIVLSDEEPDIVIVKRKKKPKVIYMEESDEEPEPQIIKKKKEEPKVEPILAKPVSTIRFC